jgi:hypothetical protein
MLKISVIALGVARVVGRAHQVGGEREAREGGLLDAL